MLDLSPYYARVAAAISTNQCLDYAADVSALLDEVQRLRRGIAAAEEHYAGLYSLATFLPTWTYASATKVAHDAQVAERMLESMYREMGT